MVIGLATLSRMAAYLTVSHWDFFFATAIGLYALHRLTLVREEGEVHERVVFEHLRAGDRRTLRNLSTVAGLRASTDYPLDTLIENGRDEVDRPDSHAGAGVEPPEDPGRTP